MKQGSRILRLLRLVSLLQGGRGQNANSLAAECGVSRRTVFRDLEALRKAEVPLEYDEERGHYSIPDLFFLSPTSLSPEEALAALVLCDELGHDLPFYQPARQAAVKLANSLPADLRNYARNVAGAISVRLGSGRQHRRDEAVYRTLIEALAERRSVAIHYAGVSDPAPLRTELAPYRLLFSRHSWYVIGLSSLHAEVRTFHVGRIQDIESTGQSYSLPAGFDLERYLGNAWNLIREPGGDVEVRVRFAPLVAANVAAVQWHPTQRTRLNEDGSLDFRVTVSGLTEIHWWILGYADQAEVLAPEELRRRVAERAVRLAGLYANPASQ